MAPRTVEDGVREARRCWDEKLNCAESVLRGVCSAQGIDLPDTAKRMATPFGGGVGRSEDICGALTGGVMAIGACVGRTVPSEDKTRSYNLAGKLHSQFGDMFGSTCCKVLNKSEFASPEHRTRCGRFVTESTRLSILVIRGQL